MELREILEQEDVKVVHCYIPVNEKKQVMLQGFPKSIKIAVARAEGFDELSGTLIDLSNEVKYNKSKELFEQGKTIKEVDEKATVVRVNIDINKLNLSENEINKLTTNELVTLRKGFKKYAVVSIEDKEDFSYTISNIIDDYKEDLVYSKFTEWAKKNMPELKKQSELTSFYIHNVSYSYKADYEKPFELSSITINGKNILE